MILFLESLWWIALPTQLHLSGRIYRQRLQMRVWFWLLWWTLWNWLVHEFQFWHCIFAPAMIGWETWRHIFIQSGCSKTCCDSLARVFPRLERTVSQLFGSFDCLRQFLHVNVIWAEKMALVRSSVLRILTGKILAKICWIFIDIDECYAGNECSANALCHNLHGSYNCTCKEGYYGDGKNCTGKASSVFIFSVPFVRWVSFKTIALIKCK